MKPRAESGGRRAEGRGVRCAKCGGTRFRTTHTEPLTNGTIRRRKTCRACGRRRVTFETGTR